MNKELLKKAEELLPKERLLLLEENNTDKSNNEMTHAYNQALSHSRQALPAIIELVREEMREREEVDEKVNTLCEQTEPLLWFSKHPFRQFWGRNIR